MRRRMFRYFSVFFEKYDLPIYPILVCSYDKPLRPEPDELVVSFPDGDVMRFDFRVVQLNRLSWREFVSTPNPLASALMAKMKIEERDRSRVKFECLRLLSTLKLDRARMRLISGFVDTYLRLNREETAVFKREIEASSLAPNEKESVMEITTSCTEEGIEIGKLIGELRGRRERARNILMRLLRLKFGSALGNLTDGLTPRGRSLAAGRRKLSAPPHACHPQLEDLI